MMTQLSQISGIEKAVTEMTAQVIERREGIVEQLKPYVNGVVTEDTVDAWKKDRARLNKERTAADKERTGLEAAWKDKLKPISDAYKGIKAEYDKAIDSIDKQTKLFEEKRVAEKKELIQRIFTDYQPPETVAGWLTLSDIYDPKWENKTCKDKDILRDIEDAYSKLATDYTTLTLSNSEYEKEGLEVLRATRDLGKAFQKIAEMQEQAKRIREQLEVEQRRKEEEARRKAEAEERRKAEELLASKPVEEPVLDEFPFDADPAQEVEKPQEFDDFAFGTPEVVEETYKYMIMLSTTTEMTAAELEDTKRSLYRLGFNVLSTERIGK